MKKIKLFISYSEKDGTVAEILRRILSDCFGFDVFLSRYSNTPSDDWYLEIISHLDDCEFFIPVLSSSLKSSSFANQEIGYAVKAGKTMFPVPIDSTEPFDMFHHIHRVECGSKEEVEVLKAATKIAGLILTAEKFKSFWQRAAWGLSNALLNSNSYRTTGAIIFTIIRAGGALKFSKDDLKAIQSAVKLNPNVKGSEKLGTLKLSLKAHFQFELK